MPATTVAGNRNPRIVSPSGRQFRVIVRDTLGDFAVSLGHTNIARGVTALLPIRLNTPIDLSSVSFRLDLPKPQLDQLTLLPIAPELSSATLRPSADGHYQVDFIALPGSSLGGDRTIANLRFRAIPGADSAVQMLEISELVGQRPDGTLTASPSVSNGRVIIIGGQPYLEATFSDGATRDLTVFGTPGVTYRIEATDRLETNATWILRATVPLTGSSGNISVPSGTSDVEFFRARVQ